MGEPVPTPILDRPADVAGLRRLLRAGAIDAAEFVILRDRLLPPARWLALVQTTLLGLGAALVCAGVICLFAFNWQGIGRFTKLGSIAAATAGCVVAAAVRGRATLPGKVLTTVAAVFVGVFLAVFGQVYQTGADAYELFAGWAVLILPWVLAAEFTTLWVLWFLLVNAAVLLFWEQVGMPSGRLSMELVFGLLAAADCGLLALRELAVRKGVRWLRETWARYVMLVAVLYLLTMPVLRWLFDASQPQRPTALSLALWGAAIAALAAAAWFAVPDILALALIATDVGIVIDCVLARAMFDGGDPVAGFFTLTVVTLGLFAGAVMSLRGLHGRLAARAGGGS